MTLAPSELRIFTLKVAILIGFLVLGYMIFELRNILGILAFSAFVTILLSPILTSLKKRKIPEWISISLIAMGVVVFFITLFFLVAPVLARESVRLVNLAIEKINYQPGQPLQMILPEPIRTALSPFIDNLDIEQLINFLKTHLQDISTTIGSGGMRAVGAFA
jgi:predicted PurR-regulated permease PerM